MDLKIPSVVCTVLHEYMTAINGQIPQCVEGLYIHGSIALNAFVDNSSDIDFISVVNRRLNETDIQLLSNIHREISDKYPHPDMDGAYLQWGDLGKPESDVEHYPFYNSKTLHPKGLFNQNPVTWWTLKHHGIVVVGPDPKELKFDVDKDLLIDYVFNNMNTYWSQRLVQMENNRNMLSQFSNSDVEWEIEWSVLGMLRQYYTLRESDIISKVDAGEYALIQMPEQWHRATREALSIRKALGERYYASNEERITDFLAFLRYILEHCNQMMRK